MSDGHGHGHGHGMEALPDAPLSGDLEANAGAGHVLFLDAQSGIAGDMLVAALLDLGVPLTVIESALASLPLDGYRLSTPRVSRSGIAARRFVVEAPGEQPQRSYAQIREMLEEATLPEGARVAALSAFRRLAEAEAAVHAMTVEEVHFHEVGAVDSIVDIVAACAALAHLGAEIVAPPLPLGRGGVVAQHGPLPVPAPATLLCLRGVPTTHGGADAELVTPTGACLVATMASRFARWPDLIPRRVGWGSGTRDLADRPNLLRVVLGTASTIDTTDEPDASASPFALLETNVDDATAETMAYALGRVMDAGALDAWSTPIGMKKGRPATMLSVLVRRAQVEELGRLLMAESGTLGVRVRPCARIERSRRVLEVETPYGDIAVKIAEGDGLPRHAAPEFEACKAAAERHGVPLRRVYEAALAALDR